MATRTLGAKVALEGEKEFKQAISNINSGLSTLNSEMRKTTAEYQDNADSVEALTKKGDVLERTLLTQKEKVEELRKALANAKEQYGEADSRTMKWEQSLNNAEAAVYNTEDAIKKNNEALEKAKDGSSGLSGILDELTDSFKNKLPTGVQKAIDSIGGFSTKSVAAIGLVTAAISGTIEMYKKLINMTVEAASNADNTLTLSQITGIDTETLQELEYASELIDVSVDTIRGSLTKLTNNMYDAANGNDTLAETFRSLGVSIEDTTTGQLRSAEDVFYDVIDALGGVQSETEMDAIAMDLMGKSAQDLKPLIKQGSETLKEYQEEAHDVSYVLNNEQLAALGAVDDATQRLQKQQESITNQMSAQMAPAVEELYTTWTELIGDVGQSLIDSGIITNIASILENIIAIVDPTDDLAENGVPALTTAFKALSDVLGAVSLTIAAIADAMDMIESIFTLDWSGFTNSLGFGYSSGNANNVQRTLMQQNGTWDQYSDYYTQKWSSQFTSQNASGDQNYSGGWTLVGESGAELAYLPQGSTIYNNQDSRDIGGDNFYFTIDASSVKELNDLVRIAQNSRMSVRMRG